MNTRNLASPEHWKPATNNSDGYGYTTVSNTAGLLNGFTATGGTLTATSNTLNVGVSIEDADLRVTIDGSTPTTAHGTKLLQGKLYYFSKSEYAALRVIRAASTDARVDVTQYTI